MKSGRIDVGIELLRTVKVCAPVPVANASTAVITHSDFTVSFMSRFLSD
jgi:hypothetical protein